MTEVRDNGSSNYNKMFQADFVVISWTELFCCSSRKFDYDVPVNINHDIL